MSDLAQHLQALQLRLHQEGELNQLFITMQEIEALVAEYHTKEAYDLLASGYRALCDATSDDSDAARDLILQRLLPWLIAPTLSENADRARGDGGKILRQWLDQYPEDMRQELLLSILDVFVQALQTQPTRPLCWTISYLGYRRPDIVSQLWEVIHHHDDELGDAALRTLEELQVQGDDRKRLLDELHSRVALHLNIPLLGALGRLADISSIPIIQECLSQLSPEDTASVMRSLALGVLTDIADAHDSDSAVQKTIWETITTLYESMPEPYAFDIYLGGETASHCNDPGVPRNLIRWLEHHPDDTDGAIYRRYLLYLRLSECIRPRQLLETSFSDLSNALALLQHDASRDSGNTGRWATQESHSKEQAWEILLYLGNAIALSPELFEKAVVQETSGYLRGRIMELLACFRWTHLPQQVLAWITERVDLQQETASQELPSRRGAEDLARSAATREAFEALLKFGLTFNGAVLQETANALASVTLTLVQQGEPDIVEALLSTLQESEEERHRIAAIEALAWVAGNDLYPQQVIPQIVIALQDEQRSDFERSRLAHILGVVSHKDVTSDVIEVLQHVAQAGQTQAGASALEALVQNSGLLEMPDLLKESLGLSAEGNQWNYPHATTANRWIVGMIGTLYIHAPDRFAPAMAALLEHVRMFELITLLRTLDKVHHIELQPIPHEVRTTLLTRLHRLQDAMFNTSTQLLQTGVHMIPDTFAEQAWESEWDTWTPETRASLAEALGQGMYTSEIAHKQAHSHLLQLLCDTQYRVRRAACRSLATIAPDVLFHVCIAWTYAPLMELRRRAAEALSWLSTEQREINELHQRLAADPDPLVREVTARAIIERRQRIWAGEYLAHIRRAYGQGNQELLAAWRYGHALTKIGDEVTLAELQKDLTSPQLIPHERQWLRWIFKNIQEHWKKTMDQWPKPWFRWTGKVIYEQAHIGLASNLTLKGMCSLYQQENTHSDSPKALWGGAFWFNPPTAVPKGEILTLHLAGERSGLATVVASIKDEVWLLEGKDHLTQ